MSTIPAPAEPSRGTAPALVPEATIAVAVETIAEALSPATRRAYAAGWDAWEAWATAHGAEALPANPAELVLWLSDAAYDVDGEPALAPATCAQRLAAVAHQHRSTVEASTGEPLADPTKHPRVREWLRGYRRRTAALGAGAPRQAAPLTATAAAAIRAVATTPRPGRGGRPESPEVARRRGTQDLVIVGLARDGLLRRAELAALRWGDLQPAPDGGAGVLTVRRSKTDPDGEGAVLWISPQTMRDMSAWGGTCRRRPAPMWALRRPWWPYRRRASPAAAPAPAQQRASRAASAATPDGSAWPRTSSLTAWTSPRRWPRAAGPHPPRWSGTRGTWPPIGAQWRATTPSGPRPSG